MTCLFLVPDNWGKLGLGLTVKCFCDFSLGWANEQGQYYTTIGMALGMCFGVAFGASIGTFGIGTSMGLAIGMVIGLLIGKSMDAKAENENRGLDTAKCQK